MARVVISALADADTAAIIADLRFRAGQRVADKYDALLLDLYHRLAVFPGSGPPRPRLGSNIRIGIVSPYIIIYRYLENADTVTVLRVVHGRRRISGTMLMQNS